MFPRKEENASSIEFKMFDQGFISIIKGPLNALDFCENRFCGLVFTNMLTYTI